MVVTRWSWFDGVILIRSPAIYIYIYIYVTIPVFPHKYNRLLYIYLYYRTKSKKQKYSNVSRGETYDPDRYDRVRA